MLLTHFQTLSLLKSSSICSSTPFGGCDDAAEYPVFHIFSLTEYLPSSQQAWQSELFCSSVKLFASISGGFELHYSLITIDINTHHILHGALRPFLRRG